MPFVLRTALRHLLRRPLDATLNVLGLAVGFALVALVGLYLHGELRVDRFHPDAERVVRLSTQMTDPAGDVMTAPTGPGPLGAIVRDEVPGVEALVQMRRIRVPVQRGDERLRAQGYITDASFFDVFGYTLASGDPATALSDPGSVVLTAEAAERLVGTRDALGRTLTVSDSLQFTVSGVLAESPRSHLQFEVLRPQAGWSGGDWQQLGVYAYARLAPSADVSAFAKTVQTLATARSGGAYDGWGTIETFVEPLPTLYFSETPDPYINVYGDRRLVTLLALIALIVLAVAAVNFVNLATARSADRAQEIGVRKSLGAGRGGLVVQFLSEAVALAAVASAVALGLVALGLPVFNAIVGSELGLAMLLRPEVVAVALGVVVLVGAGAGLYPALWLVRLRPVESLRGHVAASQGGARLRQGLVVFQFAVSTALLVATLVVGAQLRHLRAQDSGFAEGRVLAIDADEALTELYGGGADRLKAAVEAVPGVEAASWTMAPPGVDGWVGQIVSREGAGEGGNQTMETVIVDADYAETLGLRLAAGRDLDIASATDAQTGVLLNASAARALGWTPEQAVGERIQTSGRSPGEVVGVLADYRHHGAGVPVGPQVLFSQNPQGHLLVRAASGVPLSALRARLEATWAERLPGYRFDAEPLDAVFDAQYAAEQRLARAFGVFAGLAVVVACLGLFGLAAYVVGARRKEVGVRKVLGATVGGLVARLSADFAVPVGVGLALAAGPTWWALSRWLDGFAERVALTPAPFLAAGLGALALALLTVSLHTVRAATVDPARALRSE